MGGLLHKMFAVETTLGKFAIKALHPHIILRHVAMRHYINSERIVKVASENVSALPAKSFNGESIQELAQQYYLG